MYSLTGTRSGDIAEYCILVGDPARAYKVAKRFSNVQVERKNREYVTITGKYNGLRVTVMGTGMGCSTLEMALIELVQLQPNLTLVRCGSCGSLNSNIKLGDVVISIGALSFENTSKDYADSNMPAIAHNDVFLALIHAATKSGHTFHTGLTAAMASFHMGQGRETPPFPRRNTDLIQRLSAQKVANMEMEASTLFILSHLAGVRAGNACAVYAERITGKVIDEQLIEGAESKCIDIVLSSLLCLREMDEQKGSNTYWHPGLLNGTK